MYKKIQRSIIVIASIFSASLFGQHHFDIYNNTAAPAKEIYSFEKTAAVAQTTPSIINVVTSPTGGTSSLAFDGTGLWVGSFPNQIFKISVTNGTILKTINTNIQRPYGLACVHGFLWVVDNLAKTINKLDTVNGNVLFSFNSFNPNGYDAGLAWDGSKLWHVDTNMDSIYVFDTLGIRIKTHKINLPTPVGLTFQNNRLWVGDNSMHKIFKMDTASYNFLDTVISPRQYPNGLAFDGQHLWVAENENSMGIDSVYELGIDNIITGIKNLNNTSADVHIYPNPGAGKFTFSNIERGDKIEVFDLFGKLINDAIAKNNSVIIDLEEKEKGIYTYRITNSKQEIKTGKLVLK